MVNEQLKDVTGLWLVGCGAMGGALLGRWLQAGLRAEAMTVIDPSPRNLPAGFSGRVLSAPGAGEAPDAVVLGIKPQGLDAAFPALTAAMPPGVPLISMLAGIRAAALGRRFPGHPVVRIVPNTPARVGLGTTALFSADAPGEVRALAETLMRAAGSVHWLDDEGRFDAFTALGGSGPAYVFRMIEALAGAGEAAGLGAELSAQLALETVAGAAALASAAPEPPAVLRQQVTSPNGVTQAGLDVLDGDGALSTLIRNTVRAACERSRALGAEGDR